MFFEGYSAQQLIVMLVGVIIAISQGFVPGVSILEWLKSKFGWKDELMQYVVIGFFMALAALASWATGELEGFKWSLESILSFFGVFYGIAQLAYERLKSVRGE
jgi:MFS-type transporter involved in bile tolerance (Atg22 family)